MRRGLLAWSEEEVSRPLLDSRVARCRDAMAASGLDALLVYTNFPRPAAVSWLTHFVPYWSQGVLAILPQGAPVFTVSLSKRVANWIEETAHMGEIVCTPNLGRALGELISNAAGVKAAGAKKIGVVELSRLPGTIVSNLRDAAEGIVLIDASDLFATLRSPADDTEIALTIRAAEIAHKALDLAKPGNDPVSAEILSDIERSARMQGCEEILIDIAEDLSADKQFRRLDGPSVFANRYAVRLSVAYKGHWVRVGRTFEQDGADRAAAIEHSLSEALPGSGATPPAGFEALDRVTEGCIGSAPLTILSNPKPGAIVSITQRWRDAHGFWLVSEPVLIGAGSDRPAALLVDLSIDQPTSDQPAS
jgi:hypothetical protein